MISHPLSSPLSRLSKPRTDGRHEGYGDESFGDVADVLWCSLGQDVAILELFPALHSEPVDLLTELRRQEKRNRKFLAFERVRNICVCVLRDICRDRLRRKLRRLRQQPDHIHAWPGLCRRRRRRRPS